MIYRVLYHPRWLFGISEPSTVPHGAHATGILESIWHRSLGTQGLASCDEKPEIQGGEIWYLKFIKIFFFFGGEYFRYMNFNYIFGWGGIFNFLSIYLHFGTLSCFFSSILKGSSWKKCNIHIFDSPVKLSQSFPIAYFRHRCGDSRCCIRLGTSLMTMIWFVYNISNL